MFQRSRNVITIAAGFAVVFLVSVLGFWWQGIEKCGPYCWVTSTVGFFVRDNSLKIDDPNPLIVLARYVAPWVIPFVALLATIRAYLANFRRDLRGLRASHQSDHAIVCGIGDIGLLIVENLRSTGENVVAIDLDDNSANSLTAERLGATLLKGDATHLPVLLSAGLSGARIVVVCAGEDADNVDIALRIKGAVDGETSSRDKPLLVLVELRDEWLFGRLIDHDQQALGSAACEIRLFNTYQNTARLLLQTIPPPRATAAAIGAFIIVGFGSMGREVARQILAAAVMPLGQTARMLIVDRKAEAMEKQFLAGVAPIAGYATVKFVAADLDDDAAENWEVVEQILREETPFAVAVCLPDDRASLHVAVTMRALLDRLGETGVPIYMRLGRHLRLGQFAGTMEQRADAPDRLRPFGSMQEILAVDIVVGERLDALARAYHEHRRSKQPASRQREPSWRPWHELAEQFKMSSRREADHMTIKLAQAGFTIAEVASPKIYKFSAAELQLLAKLEHRRWTIERLLQGWKYGEKRDNALRLNPFLVEWEGLPRQEQRANLSALAALPEILALTNREVRRADIAGPRSRRAARQEPAAVEPESARS
jgi:Trk K+ transport system NAD-binding subunit